MKSGKMRDSNIRKIQKKGRKIKDRRVAGRKSRDDITEDDG